MKRSFIEIKWNGAGRPYFVILDQEGKRILISQSFDSQDACKECFACLMTALDVKAADAGEPRTFEATMDSKGVLLLKLHMRDGTTVLLSGSDAGDDEQRITLDNIREVLSNFNTRHNEY